MSFFVEDKKYWHYNNSVFTDEIILHESMLYDRKYQILQRKNL